MVLQREGRKRADAPPPFLYNPQYMRIEMQLKAIMQNGRQACRDMELRSVLTEAPEIAPGKTASFNYRWMHHFFSEDVSLKNQPVIEMQRRAIWIGIAFILQGLNEIPFSAFLPFGGMVQFFLILSSFCAIWQAFRRGGPKQRAAYRQAAATWQRFLLLVLIIVAGIGTILFGRGLILSILPPQFGNDGTSLDTNAAILLLQGRNPYTDSNMLDLARRFPIQPDWTTPLRQGEFTNRLDYPTLTELQSVLDTDMKAGTAPEFESESELSRPLIPDPGTIYADERLQYTPLLSPELPGPDLYCLEDDPSRTAALAASALSRRYSHVVLNSRRQSGCLLYAADCAGLAQSREALAICHPAWPCNRE